MAVRCHRMAEAQRDRCHPTAVEVGLRPMVAVGLPAALVGERGMFLPHLVMAAVDTLAGEPGVGTTDRY